MVPGLGINPSLGFVPRLLLLVSVDGCLCAGIGRDELTGGRFMAASKVLGEETAREAERG